MWCYAAWYGNRPSSSVSLERAFAVLRGMEDKLRMRLQEKNVILQLKAKVNKSIAGAVVRRVSRSVPGLK